MIIKFEEFVSLYNEIKKQFPDLIPVEILDLCQRILAPKKKCEAKK